MPTKKKETKKTSRKADEKKKDNVLIKSEQKKVEQNISHKNDVLDLILKEHKNRASSFLRDEDVAYEGQLAIDMAETKTELVVISTIAGAKPEDISVHVDGDMLTIRGKRSSVLEEHDGDYFYKECYWGWFSRSIVLPVEVKNDEARAEFHNGVLVVRIPKETKTKEVSIHVIEE